MPTALRSGPYRLYFYSHESGEPPHVHIDRDDQSCKFWLKLPALARNLSFSAKELGALGTSIKLLISTLSLYLSLSL